MSSVEIEYLGGEVLLIQDQGLIQIQFDQHAGKVIVITQGGGRDEATWDYVRCIRTNGSVKLL